MASRSVDRHLAEDGVGHHLAEAGADHGDHMGDLVDGDHLLHLAGDLVLHHLQGDSLHLAAGTTDPLPALVAGTSLHGADCSNVKAADSWF